MHNQCKFCGKSEVAWETEQKGSPSLAGSLDALKSSLKVSILFYRLLCHQLFAWGFPRVDRLAFPLPCCRSVLGLGSQYPWHYKNFDTATFGPCTFRMGAYANLFIGARHGSYFVVPTTPSVAHITGMLFRVVQHLTINSALKTNGTALVSPGMH